MLTHAQTFFRGVGKTHKENPFFLSARAQCEFGWHASLAGICYQNNANTVKNVKFLCASMGTETVTKNII